MSWEHSALEPLPDSYYDRSPTSTGEPATSVDLLVQAEVALGEKCESPIESRFGAELIVATEKYGFRVDPQFALDRYRYDFAVFAGDELRALVECDGKKFHSTPEQIANDEAKDRAAMAAGITVFRFTGSDIYRDAQKCAQVVVFRIWRA